MLFRLLLKTCETLKDQYVYRPSDISYKRAPFCIFNSHVVQNQNLLILILIYMQVIFNSHVVSTHNM